MPWTFHLTYNECCRSSDTQSWFRTPQTGPWSLRMCRPGKSHVLNVQLLSSSESSIKFSFFFFKVILNNMYLVDPLPPPKNLKIFLTKAWHCLTQSLYFWHRNILVSVILHSFLLWLSSGTLVNISVHWRPSPSSPSWFISRLTVSSFQNILTDRRKYSNNFKEIFEQKIFKF